MSFVIVPSNRLASQLEAGAVARRCACHKVLHEAEQRYLDDDDDDYNVDDDASGDDDEDGRM